MGLMDKLKGAAGVGTATMEVDIKQRPTKRGEDLVALIRVIGGKQEIQSSDGRPIHIDGHAIFYRANQPNSEGVTIDAGKTLEFPITVKIPADGPLTGETIKYDFGVRVDLEGTSDPSFNTQFEIKA